MKTSSSRAIALQAPGTDQLSFDFATAAPAVPESAPAAPARFQVDASDKQLIGSWIEARCANGSQGHTARAYRREAERFAIWLRAVPKASLLEASFIHCARYRDFLRDPEPDETWCAPRGTPRTSSAWRPFEGPLASRSVAQACVILKSLFAFLVAVRAVASNPWEAVAKPRPPETAVNVQRSLDATQLAALLESRQDGGQALQLQWNLEFLMASGLRISEFAVACCEDLRWVDLESSASTLWSPAPIHQLTPGGWVLRVAGKGGKLRDVPVPGGLVQRLAQAWGGEGALARLPGSAPGSAHAHRDIRGPLASALRWSRAQGKGLSAQGIYLQIKKAFAQAANYLEAVGDAQRAERLRAASPHWLRHTAARRDVAAGVPIDAVMQKLGHASLAVTTVYTRPGVERLVAECAKVTPWIA